MQSTPWIAGSWSIAWRSAARSASAPARYPRASNACGATTVRKPTSCRRWRARATLSGVDPLPPGRVGPDGDTRPIVSPGTRRRGLRSEAAMLVAAPAGPLAGERFAGFANDKVDDAERGDGICPPPSEQGPQREAGEERARHVDADDAARR